MTELEMLQKLEEMLDEKRFKHSLGVRDTAEMLARCYGEDVEKARIAGVLHDCAKNIPKDEAFAICERESIPLKPVCYIEKGLVHAYLGAHIAKHEFGVKDGDILSAIYYHTTGHEDMPLLTKIIYLSDLIEPGRNIPDLEELRLLAQKDIDEALIRAINSTISHVLSKGSILDCDTVMARNFLVQEKREKSAI
ncbi:MAG: bis(5'-nucleosyl)-tetraphosphatase (symmetrical) YqeK [Clostridia bacterium]|nr:bis(5'-nucleosyl)-tetraphosphatase (symmetrical) YqeK [Clostridia bacterium]